MKKPLVIFLSLFIFSYSAKSTEIIQTPEKEFGINLDWEKIVDYVNAKVTYYYISEQIKKGNIKSDKEIENFKTFEPNLDTSNLNNIISFNDLIDYLKPYFGKTLENISSPIDSLKVRKLNTELLLASVQSILVERKSSIQDSYQFKQLKDSINSYILDQQQREEYLQPTLSEKGTERSGTTNEFISYSTLLVLAVLFFFLTIVFIIGWLHVRGEHKSKIQEIRTLKSTLEIKERELNQLITFKNNVESKSRDKSKLVKSENINARNDKNNLKKQNDNIIEEKKSQEIVLPVQAKEAENKIEQLYAGKPTENRVLKDVSTQSVPQQTIFKLNILPHNNELAEFEVVHVSDFMTRSITNSPDDYLYRVCNHENTNQEFRKEILTVKKGIANLIDGEWIVKEENKATIKFQ